MLPSIRTYKVHNLLKGLYTLMTLLIAKRSRTFFQQYKVSFSSNEKVNQRKQQFQVILRFGLQYSKQFNVLIRPSINIYTYPSIDLSIRLSLYSSTFFCLSIHHPIFIHPSINLCTHRSIDLSIYQYVCLSVYLSIHLSIKPLSTSVSFCLFRHSIVKFNVLQTLHQTKVLFFPFL